MIKVLYRLLGIAFLLLQLQANAQLKLNFKFNKVTPADFDLSKSKFDSSAGAVVIADIGSSWFEGNAKGWFSLIHKKTTRIKILNKNGFDAANVQVHLYTNGKDEEKKRVGNLIFLLQGGPKKVAFFYFLGSGNLFF